MSAHTHAFGKRVGAEQAAHRVESVVRALDHSARDAAAIGKTRLARQLDQRRAGAILALGAVAELLRNHEGRE